MSADRQTDSPPDHAALMDRVYRHQRYVYDLTRKYYLFGRDRLIRELAPKRGARVVEIGCGTARNLVQIARAYPETRLFGLDASHEMLKTATETVHRAGIESRVGLAHGYAEHISPAMFGETDPFDICIFSYSLSMIPDWKQALNAASGVLAPGGSIHVVDFGDLEGLPGPARRLLLQWLKMFHVAPRVELLHSLESAHAGSLQVLPGRYAFLLRTGTTTFF